MVSNKIMMNLIEGLKMKIDTLEKLSHEPQNYKEKCDDMEVRLVNLERIIKKTIYHVIKPNSIIEGESNENTKSTDS